MLDLLATAFSAAINVGVLWWLSGRVLGVRVGWTRTIFVSLAVVAIAVPATNAIFDAAGGTPDSPAWVLLAFGSLVAAWLLGIELIALTVCEALVPTGATPGLLALVTGLPAAWRRSRRLAKIWRIMIRHGVTTIRPNDPDRQASLARALREALAEAGVTFVKFGQTMATRPDLLPAGLVRELATLQTDVPPAPWDQVEPVVTEALGQPYREVFSSLATEPMAAASVAQVYPATLRGGTGVVVKVQRPGAQEQVRADLDLVQRFADRLEARTSWGRSMRVAALARGFAASLEEELDYRIEVANTRAVASHEQHLRIPVVYPELSSRCLLVMERVDGVPLSRAHTRLTELTGTDRAARAHALFDGVMRQILVSGVFHADLHAGNIIVTGDGVALLDFGSVGRLDRPTRTALTMLLWAASREDPISATDALIATLDRPDGLDERALERSIGELLLRFRDGAFTGGTDGLFTDQLNLVVQHGFSIPPQLAAAFRALSALDGSLRLLDPDSDLAGLARDRLSTVLGKDLSLATVREALTDQVAAMLPVIQRLPRRLDRITESLESGP